MLDQHVALRRQVVVGIHHRQRQNLLDHVVLVGLAVAGRTLASDQHVGMKIFLQDLPRKVIVQSSVVKQRRVLLDRLENQRYGHRSADRLAQIAAAVDDLLAGGRIGRNAAERHEKPVEIAAARGVGRREEFDESHVDLAGGNQVGRQPGYLLRIAEVEAQRHHRRAGPPLLEVVEILGFDPPRHPVRDPVRLEQLGHLVRRIADRVQPGDDRAHGGPRHVVDRNAVLLQSLHNPDVVEPLGPAAAHHESYLLSPGRKSGKQRQQGKKAFNARHLQIILNFVC